MQVSSERSQTQESHESPDDVKGRGMSNSENSVNNSDGSMSKPSLKFRLGKTEVADSSEESSSDDDDENEESKKSEQE